MIEDVTDTILSKRIRKMGGKLFKSVNGNMIKFVLEVKKYNYRSFIYMRDGYRDADASLKDLYNDFYYDNNIPIIANRERG